MGFFSNLFGKKEQVNPNHIFAPMAGKVVPVTEVPDPTFAEGLLGDGVAIIPTDGKIYAPCNATVGTMFSTGHAIALTTDNGAELLIHVGLETVGLNGAPFTVHVKDGDKVKKGQLMFEADLAAIQAAGLPIITPVLVCNADEYPNLSKSTGQDVTNSDVIIVLGK